ncbi:Hypothetical protein SRAE_2000261000 [Strongyloides ratti]|uniref:Uncharacterized protein n=1 Tax=Strongyloides ratti TaxID=34506 RepID=A0A090MYX6_STRRB|nr:Hypothetical protein SRAE_2000261000 [Strongyloides ratti]CEF67949.1 Hypothetical protein SRAE_2000261000 [Strongyloides ratti]
MSAYRKSSFGIQLNVENLFNDSNKKVPILFSEKTSTESKMDRLFFNYQQKSSSEINEDVSKNMTSISMSDENNCNFSSSDNLSYKEYEENNLVHSFTFALPNIDEIGLENSNQLNLFSDDSGIITNNKTSSDCCDNDENVSLQSFPSTLTLNSDEFTSYILNCPGISSDEENSDESYISGFIDTSEDEILPCDISQDDLLDGYCTPVSSQWSYDE